jgi:hypothetical protein
MGEELGRQHRILLGFCGWLGSRYGLELSQQLLLQLLQLLAAWIAPRLLQPVQAVAQVGAGFLGIEGVPFTE